MINKRKIKEYKFIDYLYFQGVLTITGFNKKLKELNLNEDELNLINGKYSEVLQ